MARNGNFQNQRLLLVEDDATLRASLAAALEGLSFYVELAADGHEAIEKIQQEVYDLLITDLRLPGLSGEEVLRRALSLYPDLIVIVITGYGDINSAVQLVKLGACDYVQKPFLKEDLILRIQRALEERRLRWESRALEDSQPESDFSHLIGESPGMRKVKELAAHVAGKSSTVLLRGETGTGKELVARAIHNHSPRNGYPLVAVNCGAIPATLMEDEFFGHEKGAFTDAQQFRVGRFEQANRGTLFLDEIGIMPLELQAKLLRVLQEREFQRIGGANTIRLDVRFIAATNSSLEQKVQDGVFREDLYYRLNVFPIFIPPLRERKEDIPLLVPHLLERICAREGLSEKQVTQEAMKSLIQNDWPGNVRHLENALEMAVILAGDREYLQPADFPAIRQPLRPGHLPPVEIPAEGVDFQSLVSRYEEALLLEGLRQSQGKRSRAAALLNLKRTTLLEKLKKLHSVPA